MSKFKVGDKVRVRSWEDMKKQYGVNVLGNIKTPGDLFTTSMKQYCGKVVIINSVIKSFCKRGLYTIKNDKVNWTFSDAMFEPRVVCNTVVIYEKGNQVIALDKATGKTGVAICSSEDTFDFYTGADLAFERLRGRANPAKVRSPKYYNGEIVCINTAADNFTVGKIYKVKNGKFTDDCGRVHGDSYPYTTFQDLNSQHYSEFIEVVR